MRTGERLIFLRNPPGPDAHINDFLDAWYRAMRSAGVPEVRVTDWPGRPPMATALSRLLPQRPLPWARTLALTPMSWASDRDIFPAGFLHRIVPWVYDCWPPNWDRWEALLRRHRVRLAFFSSSRAAQEFARRLPGVSCRWIPEAVDPGNYDPSRSLQARAIDVVELGRRSEAIHRRLEPALRDRGLRHEFQVHGAPRMYPTQRALRDALAQARVLICLPKTVTHPEAAGGVETATHRYFEGMASGCVLVGRCPAELRELWGFDPVVPIDPEAPERSVLGVIERPGDHQALVERNLRRLREVGTWDHRAAAMLADIASMRR
jgi:hypothetical protein